MSVTMRLLLNFFVLLCLCMILGACKTKDLFTQQTKGMSRYGKQEFWYTLYSNQPHSRKPDVGDQVRIDYVMKKGDEVLSASYSSKKPVFVQIPQPRYDNFFTKAIRLMGEGDSLVVLIQAVHAKELLGQYQSYFKDEEAVTFLYKVHEIKEASQVEQEIRKEVKRIESIKEAMQQRIQQFASGQLHQQLQQTPKGLRYLINQPGKGSPAIEGSWVQVHYICYLEDGTLLQDSYRNMTPLEFKLGDLSVIDGWSEGLRQLKEGAKATLFIPPSLGYGSKGMDDLIPPDANLIFYVELLSVE